MNKIIKQHIENLSSTDDKIRLHAFQSLLKTTESSVDWVYEVCWKSWTMRIPINDRWAFSSFVTWQKVTIKTA
jgi:hypothetical protein